MQHLSQEFYSTYQKRTYLAKGISSEDAKLQENFKQGRWEIWNFNKRLMRKLMRGRDIPDLISFVQSTAELHRNKAKQNI